MHRHLIAGALGCLGSSLFALVPAATAAQAQGQVESPVNRIQNSVQSGLQQAKDVVDRNLPQTSGSSNLGDGQNRSSLNGQSQINGAFGTTGDAGVQSNTTYQNRVDPQQGQLNSNQSTQIQSQATLNGQQRIGDPQDASKQYGNANQPNGTVGIGGNPSQSTQRQGQSSQMGQPANQAWNSGSMQNNGSMPSMPMTSTFNSSQYSNMQQSSTSQTAGRVYVLRRDAIGREFICVDGRPVYFDNISSASPQVNSATQNQYRAGYGNYEMSKGQTDDLRKTEQKFNGATQGSFENRTNPSSKDPSNATRETTREQQDVDKRNELNRRQYDSETKSDLDTKTDATNSSDIFNDRIGPKP